MATHPSILAWKIPGTEEPGGLQSMGLQSQTRLSIHKHYSTGNYSKYLVITCSGKEYEKKHICVYLNHFAVHQKLTL